MTRKPRITEIAEVKARGMSPDHRYFVALNHLKSVSRAIDELDDAMFNEEVELQFADELFRGVPALVTATLESYFRTTIAQLIDMGPPFRERARAQKELRIDVDTLLSMEGAKVTLGDLVAHSIPINGPGDLAARYGLVSGEDLWPKAASIWERATGPSLFPHSPEDVRRLLITSLTDLYRVRNIICHEARPNCSVGAPLAKAFCDRAIEFLLVVDYLIDDLVESARENSKEHTP